MLDIFDDTESGRVDGSVTQSSDVMGGNNEAVRQQGWTLESAARAYHSAYWNKAFQYNKKADLSKLKKDFIEEMRHLSKLRHPNITTVMGAVIGRKEEPMLIMEYMDHGSLHDMLQNSTVLLEGEQLLSFMRDIAQGVRFLHSASPTVVHGDLKARNILVDSRLRAKVADFGLAEKKRLGATGTPYWMAPELLHRETSNTTQSDVYAFGILLYEVYSRKNPYEGEDFASVLGKVADANICKRPPIPEGCPFEIERMMKKCWDGEPTRRPTFKELDVKLKSFRAARVEPTTQPSITRANRVTSGTTDGLLDELFPPHIADALRKGEKVEPETRDEVTIVFSDIVGFTNISASMSPMEVSDMLDRLYIKFDVISRKHDVFKVETIGDSWMGVTNLSKDQPDHASRIVGFSIDAIHAARETMIDPATPSLGHVNLRIGINSGPVVANVVGSRNPRYCLFGDTVNTASRMESHSDAGRIQCSAATAQVLIQQNPEIKLTPRGRIPIKGKGNMETYWVAEDMLPSYPEASATLIKDDDPPKMGESKEDSDGDAAPLMTSYDVARVDLVVPDGVGLLPIKTVHFCDIPEQAPSCGDNKTLSTDEIV
ncbi:hypothetical protein ACA910_002543 [Epithemia clementina (nom. ined.)]